MEEIMDLDKFAQRFSSLIRENQTDIQLIADQIGIKSKSTIYRYMKGEMAPKLATIKYIAEIYNVNPLWLMGYDVSMEKEFPYSAIYDFSTYEDKKLLDSAITYAIQNNLSENEIEDNDYIKSCIKQLALTDKSQMISFIKSIASKFKGKNDFNLEEYIQSLQYSNFNNENYSPKARAIARGFDKLSPENQKLYTKLLNSMLEDDEEEENK